MLTRTTSGVLCQANPADRSRMSDLLLTISFALPDGSLVTGTYPLREACLDMSGVLMHPAFKDKVRIALEPWTSILEEEPENRLVRDGPGLDSASDKPGRDSASDKPVKDSRDGRVKTPALPPVRLIPLVDLSKDGPIIRAGNAATKPRRRHW